MKIGDRIRIKRESLNLTQDDLAKKLGYKSRSTVNKIEAGINDITQSKIVAFAKALQTSPAYLMGWEDSSGEVDMVNAAIASKLSLEEVERFCQTQPSNIIPVGHLKKIPVVGTIAAGLPCVAEQNTIDYDYADVANAEEYFFLQVKGDSMINSNILDGSRVLIHKQNTANNGQIVACLVNGDEATLKRFSQKGDVVVLSPENPNYETRILSASDFDSGYAMILGVAVEVKIKL